MRIELPPEASNYRLSPSQFVPLKNFANFHEKIVESTSERSLVDNWFYKVMMHHGIPLYTNTLKPDSFA